MLLSRACVTLGFTRRALYLDDAKLPWPSWITGDVARSRTPSSGSRYSLKASLHQEMDLE